MRMRLRYPFFLFFFSLILFQHTVFADDVLIPFGQNTGGAPLWKYKGGGTNLNAIAWKDLAYGEPGWLSSASAFGFGGSPVRNTNIPEDASPGGGGVAGARYPTLYFRKVLNIPSLAAYTGFQLRTQFDDAIVVWINGVEAYRNNIAANPAYATLATAAIPNNGNDIYTATLSSSLFVNGDNIIAVEIHQSALTSSDLFFDLELTGTTPPVGEVNIFPFGENLAGAPAWRYKGGGTNLDAIAWKDLAYGEPGWLTGNAALGFGASPPVRNTAIPENNTAGGGGPAGARYPTLYFRKVVNIADPGIYAGFRIRSKFDDAIVIWINGTEAYRNNITANPAYATLATTAIANNGGDIYTTVVSSSLFVPGNNIIAVEIHQNTLTSSDLFFDMELTALTTITGTLTRGPYLQMGNQTSMTLRWRTDAPTNSRVTWGTSFGTYPNTVDDAALTTEHIVTVTGLAPDTKYWYTIGSSTQTLQATNTNYFTTLPPSNTTRKLRFLAIGDCGNNSTNQVNVKNTFLNYIGANDVDAMILLGDNAYNTGTDAEYQTNFFDVYKNDLLRNIKLYPAPGNHDYGNNTANTGLRDMPYHQNFTVPMAGEIGGEPSGVTNYYSFNIGDVHFISLDSYGKDDGNTTNMYDTSGAQANWLKADLAANTKKWTVAYFHHPPYTKTSHTSDTEMDLVAIRERFIRILERHGVDLVLCGHSHGYERSYLLKNFYNTYASPLLDANFSAASHTATGNTQNGKYDGTASSCAYTYNSGQYNHGSVYIVSGSAGQVGGTTAGYPQDCMYYSNATNGGCLYFEVDSNRLDVKFVSYATAPTPLIRDQFTIFKDVNRVHNYSVATNAPLTLTASWRGNYYWPTNGGATTQSVTINNATNGSFVYRVRDASSGNCIEDVFNVTVSGTLPVSVTSFTAKLNDDKVLLDWTTSQEQNNKYFTIERSDDGMNFHFLGKVNGAGNSSSPRSYSLVDHTPVDGMNYYRLSQTDFDGNQRFHEIRKVNYTNTRNFSAEILNNGTGQARLVVRSARSAIVNMKVIDLLGKEIANESFAVSNGGMVKDLKLRSGVYVLVLMNDSGQQISKKVIIQ